MDELAIVAVEETVPDLAYDPPLVYRFCINRTTVGAQTITMGDVQLPPGSRGRARFHACEVALFVDQGHLRLFTGPERQQYDAGENQFVFIPPGVIYALANPATVGATRLLFVYGNCPDQDAAGTTVVEDAPGLSSVRLPVGADAGGRIAIVDPSKVNQDATYEPPLVVGFGVDARTVGARTITMGRTITPPGGRNPAHYHACEAAVYKRRGNFRQFYGADRRTRPSRPGHILFMAPGLIHCAENLSTTEPSEVIFTYGNCPGKESAGTVFLEPPQVPKT